jgi:2TM domain
MTANTDPIGNDLRQFAIDRLRKRREFIQHLAVYVVVNLVLGLIWLFTTPGGFYWPMFPLFVWGIGLVFHALDAFSPVFSSASPSEEKIEREIARLTRR